MKFQDATKVMKIKSSESECYAEMILQLKLLTLSIKETDLLIQFLNDARKWSKLKQGIPNIDISINISWENMFKFVKWDFCLKSKLFDVITV